MKKKLNNKTTFNFLGPRPVASGLPGPSVRVYDFGTALAPLVVISPLSRSKPSAFLPFPIRRRSLATVHRPKSKKPRVAAEGGAGAGGHEEPPECLAGGPVLISDLPDAILGTIISLLPTDDGARTQALSTRWRRLWRSSPLNLCDGDIRGWIPWDSSRDIKAVVSRVLSTHRGPVRRLSLGWPWLGVMTALYPDLGTWLRSPAFENLQELELWQGSAHPDPMPQAAFRLSSSLRALALSGGGKYVKFPADDVDRLHFPNLKQLTVKRMDVAESALHTLLFKCPVLESLVLSQNDGFHCIRISSRTLRSFGVSDDCIKLGNLEKLRELKEVIIEDAPLLQRFFIPHHSKGDGLSVRISGAPKLEFLGSLTYGITTLELGTAILKEAMPVNSTAVVRTVKVLVVHMSPPSIDDVIGLMKCFPCLQKLYVKISLKDRSKRVQHHNPLDYLECLDLHLKKSVLINYRGMKRDVEFANFFLLNAKVLEMVELATQRRSCDSKYLSKQHTKLQLKNRVSKDAQVLFTCNSNSNDSMYIRHMHDMSIGDPFDQSLCSCRRLKLL